MSELRAALTSRRATVQLGRALARVSRAGGLIVLDGPLGAGKTFLTRALCRELGVPGELPVTSPTFALVQEHAARLRVLHADLYRLGSADEVFELGLEAARREGALLVVEWGRPYLGELGGDALIVSWESPLTTRRVLLQATGEGARTVLDALPEALRGLRWRAPLSLSGSLTTDAHTTGAPTQGGAPADAWTQGAPRALHCEPGTEGSA
ncbi:MAG: tRNA (adenosine(37)-N6)-threonylcarbamoyltransferase complex ATPase subunit type 1 TsaE [Polyangiaceae bacterium]|nr:tRNA (adenosine(37)-N6)-threonylcarbamoyltransferase complex ATPase subunit type 1 TsaE [Polyangiaceae bacterium]MCW5789696.1 tRNA (adenosine(37)-N6)-threonylcarbamoyltransferase complex ATPase subunit type 1 TsaE [Polyangiaceae bacterium]